MTEKKDLQTDDQVGSVTIPMGDDDITGLPMFRRYRGLTNDTFTKQDIIKYEEWVVAKDGKVYEELHRVKEYIVIDIDAVKDEKGNITEPAYPAYSGWFAQLAPVLLPSINKTLSVIPKNAVSGYVTSR